MNLYFNALFLILISISISNRIKAQCNQNYNWTTWQNFSGTSATGVIDNNGQLVNVTMTANYTFGSTPNIYNYPVFNGFNAPIPNTTVPETSWAAGDGGITTMCFDQVVRNPVLLFSSIGRPDLFVTLQFSIPYLVLYDGGGTVFNNDTTITGNEGYTILLFPGDFSCVSIYSNTPEYYTNITWGLNPPLFPVTISGDSANCGSVTLTAAGGVSYSWSGGVSPRSATNTFYTSGTYFLTASDENGCTVTTSQTVTLGDKTFSNIDFTICEGQNYSGYTSAGTYLDTFVTTSGCDSIRTLRLTVKPGAISTLNQSICEGQYFLGYDAAGTYIDTFTASNGCDSIQILNLTVKSKSYSTINQSICNGQVFLGRSTTGVYLDTLTAANGCDSIRTLNLTVTPNKVFTVNKSICQGQSYFGYSVSGLYRDTLVTATGCDSIQILDLKVLPNSFSNFSVSICEGETFLGYTTSGTYIDTIAAFTGCDSIITVTLTVLKNCEVYFPSAFSPNNDGKNELFKILNARNLENYILMIYNRWGQKVFETKDYAAGWNGIYNGTLQPTGVYVWYSQFKIGGENKQMKGTLTLIR